MLFLYDNNIKDMDESDIDCGGNDCDRCTTGMECVTDNDCSSNSCSDSKCDAPASTAPTAAAPPCKIIISVTGNTFKNSHAIIWVHDSKETWDTNESMGDNAKYKLAKEISPPTGTYDVEFDVAGTYAVILLNDENNNGKCDTNILGIPTEGVGASNGASGGPFGGPKWDDAKFEAACGQQVDIPVTLWP